MGYESEFSYPVPFDIETGSIDGVDAFIEPASAPSNYKSQDAIDKYVAEANAKARDKTSLDIDLCRILAIGYDDSTPTSQLGPTVLTMPLGEVEERANLRHFWKVVGDRPLLGYNCLQFDLPVLLRRSIYLNVEPRPLMLGKYKHPGIIDLMQILSFDGLVPYRSLSFYAKRFGLDVPVDTSTGADIARLVAAGDWDAVKAHCRIDVLKTTALARRIGLLPTPVAEAEVV